MIDLESGRVLGAARDGRLGRGDRLGRERRETVRIGSTMEPRALDCEGLVTDS